MVERHVRRFTEKFPEPPLRAQGPGRQARRRRRRRGRQGDHRGLRLRRLLPRARGGLRGDSRRPGRRPAVRGHRGVDGAPGARVGGHGRAVARLHASRRRADHPARRARRARPHRLRLDRHPRHGPAQPRQRRPRPAAARAGRLGRARPDAAVLGVGGPRRGLRQLPVLRQRAGPAGRRQARGHPGAPHFRRRGDVHGGRQLRHLLPLRARGGRAGLKLRGVLPLPRPVGARRAEVAGCGGLVRADQRHHLHRRQDRRRGAEARARGGAAPHDDELRHRRRQDDRGAAHRQGQDLRQGHPQRQEARRPAAPADRRAARAGHRHPHRGVHVALPVHLR